MTFKIKLFLCLWFVTVLDSCTTVEVPLGGIMVGRPHTMGSIIGIRATAGGCDQPKVQGIVDEVKDTQGSTVNPLIADSVSDGKGSTPFFELGLGFMKRAELDISSHRGASAMFDVYRDDRWTSSISISRARYTVTNNSTSQSQDSKSKARHSYVLAENSEDGTFKSIDHLTGKSTNTNFTVLGSSRFGDQVWAQFSIYGGIGINQIWVEISDRESNDTKTRHQLAPSALLGIQGKLAIFELSIESAGIHLQERTGNKKWIPLLLASITTRFDWFGDSSGKDKSQFSKHHHLHTKHRSPRFHKLGRINFMGMKPMLF